MMSERAKKLATLVLTGSDRITKQMRQDAFQLLEYIRQEEAAKMEIMESFDVGCGQIVRITQEQQVKYRRLIEGGTYIEAIKQARLDQKLGLKEAKYLIDAIRDKYRDG